VSSLGKLASIGRVCLLFVSAAGGALGGPKVTLSLPTGLTCPSQATTCARFRCCAKGRQISFALSLLLERLAAGNTRTLARVAVMMINSQDYWEGLLANPHQAAVFPPDSHKSPEKAHSRLVFAFSEAAILTDLAAWLGRPAPPLRSSPPTRRGELVINNWHPTR
jgi:hypothetical protein